MVLSGKWPVFYLPYVTEGLFDCSYFMTIWNKVFEGCSISWHFCTRIFDRFWSGIEPGLCHLSRIAKKFIPVPSSCQFKNSIPSEIPADSWFRLQFLRNFFLRYPFFLGISPRLSSGIHPAIPTVMFPEIPTGVPLPFLSEDFLNKKFLYSKFRSIGNPIHNIKICEAFDAHADVCSVENQRFQNYQTIPLCLFLQ